MHINPAHIIQELFHIVALLHETGILDIALEHTHEIVEIVKNVFS